MVKKHQFVVKCPKCGAPVAMWELDMNGKLTTYFEDLHWLRTVDVSLGRPPRVYPSDEWNYARKCWDCSTEDSNG